MYFYVSCRSRQIKMNLTEVKLYIEKLNQFSALFTFISVIFFTSKLAMQTEIVAILSGGVSFRRLMWPYMLGAGIIATTSLALSLWIIPEGQKESVEFQSKYFKSNQLIEYDHNVYRHNPSKHQHLC